MRLYDLVRAHAVTSPGSLAIIEGSSFLTYEALDGQVLRSAAHMHDIVSSLRPGGAPVVLAMCMDRSVETLQTILAASLIGLPLCVADPNLSERELRAILSDCRPAVVFSQPLHARKLQAVRDGLPFKPHLEFDSFSAAAPALFVLDSRCSCEEDFLVLYTSGATGKPKGVVQSQAGLIRRLCSWIKEAGSGPRDTHLCVLPLTHAYGLIGVALPTLASGGALHLLSLESHTIQNLLRYIEDRGIKCFYGLPLHFRLMLRLPETAKPNLSSLSMAMVAAAPIDATTMVAFEERFGIGMNNSYGTSETGIITYNHRGSNAPAISIGKPIEGIKYELRNSQLLDHRWVGELFIRTNAMAAHYTDASFGPITQDGWFNTGDLVHEDDKGYLHICGRTSLLINMAGNKFMPAEVESAIAELSGVADVAVLAVADGVTNEKVVAFIVRGTELSEADVRFHCRQRLAGFKVPAVIRWVDQIPRTALKKVNRNELLKHL